MSSTPYEQSLWIDLILKRAAECRAAGVLSIGVDGYAATFAPADPVTQTVGTIDKPDSSVASDNYVAPLDDPATYPDGIVPGFKIKKLDVVEFYEE